MADYTGQQGLYWSVSGGPVVGEVGAGALFGYQRMSSLKPVTIQELVNSSASFGVAYGEGFAGAIDYNPETSAITVTVGIGEGGWGGAGGLNIASGFFPVCPE